MKLTRIAPLAIVLSAALAMGACANTIRGAGADTANTINATQNAGKNVSRAAQ